MTLRILYNPIFPPSSSSNYRFPVIAGIAGVALFAPVRYVSLAGSPFLFCVYAAITVITLLHALAALYLRSLLPFLKHIRPLFPVLVPACLGTLIPICFLVLPFLYFDLFGRWPGTAFIVFARSAFAMDAVAITYATYLLIAYRNEFPRLWRQYRSVTRDYLKKIRRLRRLKHALSRQRAEAAKAAQLPALLPPTFAPAGTMLLKLKRSERPGRWGKIIFMLDARMELPAEQLSQIHKYQLGGTVIYESEARQRHAEKAAAQLEMTRYQPSLTAGIGTQALGIGKTTYRVARAGYSSAAAALSLRVTIYSLVSGIHVECESMRELLEAEEAITAAGRGLKSFMETAATFDGQELIIEL